jgi:hypothetical protein
LKGPDAKTLASKQHLHRGLAPILIQAIAQVNDYNESILDPANLASVRKILGYVPEIQQRAVLIGRNPPPEDISLWEKRRAEQLSVKIITYDELLEEQRTRHVWRKGHIG